MERRMSRVARALGALALVTVGLVGVSAAPASAADDSPPAAAAALTAENQDGVPSKGPSFNYSFKCSSGAPDGIGASVCFQPYGDLLYVDDTQGDNHAAYMYWENWQNDRSGHAVLVRYGRCYDRLGAAAYGEAVCAKNFYEDSTHPNAVGGEGSWLTFAACEVDVGCTATTDLYNYE
jgi:hypothetical protein